MAPLSQEHKEKMAEGRRRARDERKTRGPQSEVQEQIAAQPQTQVLGTIPADKLTDTPQVDWSTRWISGDGTVIDLREMPAWAREMTRKGASGLDAKTFVDFPDDWVTRWQHPKRIETDGYRDWLPMMASHPSVTVKVRSMIDASNNIRLGLNGPILCFMPRAWWEKKQAIKRRDMLRRTVGVVDAKMTTFTEDVARGRFGKHVKPYGPNDRGSFPLNPAFDGRAVREHDPT